MTATKTVTKTVTKITAIHSEHGFFDGVADEPAYDAEATIDAFINQCADAIEQAYPGAKVIVTMAPPNDLTSRIHIECAGDGTDHDDQEPDHDDIRADVERIQGDVWDRADFWV